MNLRHKTEMSLIPRGSLARPVGNSAVTRYEREIVGSEPTARSLRECALRTLLYYDIWEFPLSASELHLFLPVKTLHAPCISLLISPTGKDNPILEHKGFFFVRGRTEAIVARRRARERHARWMWRMAHISGHVIKRFPFVRAVFVSGELSKNVAGRGSDVDFFVLTEPGRLWISRTLLILFKKLFLLNSKKFFCLNSFRSIDNLTLNEKNIYIASEVAHVKALYNTSLFATFMESNRWVNTYFPNFHWDALPSPRASDHDSLLQRWAERAMSILPLDRLDTFLMGAMQRVWAKRYPQYDRRTREKIFRCTKQESLAYVGNFQDRVLAEYRRKLSAFGIVA